MVGTKVRVRGFAECPFRLEKGEGVVENISGTRHVCHRVERIGQEGYIRRIFLTGGHRYEIAGLPRLSGRPNATFGHYAAIELEPLEE